MIKILVLDDNQKKIQKISEKLVSIEGLTSSNIEVASDIMTAKSHMLSSAFDVLLLDMQVPNRFDQNSEPYGGLNLLKELKISKRYNIPTYIIGITAHDDIHKEVSDEFEKQLFPLVKYEESSDEWAKKICENIKHILFAKKVNKETVKINYNYDLAIICALSKVELESIKRLSDKWNTVNISNDSTTYYSTTFKNDSREVKVIAASSPQMGMTAASVLSMKLIQNFRPKYLVMTGIAAGVRTAGINLGDILIADPSWDYGSGKQEEVNESVVLYPDPQQIRIDADLSEKFKVLSEDKILLENIKNIFAGDKPATSLNIHVGPFASGASVIADSSILDSIKAHNRKLIGIDMEAYGVLYSAANCTKPRPQAFSVKSVCDFADSEKGDSYQRYAAHTSANFLYKLFLEHIDLD